MTTTHKIVLGVAALALISLTAAFALNGSNGKGSCGDKVGMKALSACTGCAADQAKDTCPTVAACPEKETCSEATACPCPEKDTCGEARCDDSCDE